MKSFFYSHLQQHFVNFYGQQMTDSIYPFFPLLVGLDSPLGAEARLPSDAVYMHVMYGLISLS